MVRGLGRKGSWVIKTLLSMAEATMTTTMIKPTTAKRRRPKRAKAFRKRLLKEWSAGGAAVFRGFMTSPMNIVPFDLGDTRRGDHIPVGCVASTSCSVASDSRPHRADPQPG